MTDHNEAETPRTDAECGGPPSGDDTWPSCYVYADFARELERELSAATSELERLRAEVESIHAKDRQKTNEINILTQENRTLSAEVERLRCEREVIEPAYKKALALATLDNAALRLRVSDLEKERLTAWPAIDTAPRGEKILVTRLPATTEPPVMIVWFSNQELKHHRNPWCLSHFKKLRWKPTHWRPLPRPEADFSQFTIFDESLQKLQSDNAALRLRVSEMESQLAEMRGILSLEMLIHDSYGVHGSDFYTCPFCHEESGAGVLNKGVPHAANCILHGESNVCESVVSMIQERDELRHNKASLEAQVATAKGALEYARDEFSLLRLIGHREHMKSAIERIEKGEG